MAWKVVKSKPLSASEEAAASVLAVTHHLATQAAARGDTNEAVDMWFAGRIAAATVQIPDCVGRLAVGYQRARYGSSSTTFWEWCYAAACFYLAATLD